MHFLRPSWKSKKKLYFLIFREIEFSVSNISKFLTFSQKKAFLIFRETETPQKNPKSSSYFRKQNFLIFRETYISRSNFSSSKNEKNPLWYFRKWKLKSLVPSLKTYISGENLQGLKIKKFTFLCIKREFFKHKCNYFP